MFILKKTVKFFTSQIYTITAYTFPLGENLWGEVLNSQVKIDAIPVIFPSRYLEIQTLRHLAVHVQGRGLPKQSRNIK